ncbi:MAG: hypothetical protein IMY78_00820 [Chloroflexi bacterium]|nr:hypothetical protein [Chloroflexota bacterium]
MWTLESAGVLVAIGSEVNGSCDGGLCLWMFAMILLGARQPLWGTVRLLVYRWRGILS